MSLDHFASARLCYAHCNFCNTILAVSVPSYTMLNNAVTIVCGHCGKLLSFDVGVLPPKPAQLQISNKQLRGEESESSSRCKRISSKAEHQPKTISPQAMEKRQRVPSAYNRFINGHISLECILQWGPEIWYDEIYKSHPGS
ncbi:putative axial regulator YABBY 2 isoform X2 [Carica papaya]|uniref:putative axial regulator YABBY 2 isoform X2 n=1 Tax=Carica papaya TaxID=3649 RepID=UPI000B8CF00F|nr:putative axial regulator YABBY 2 isoform X2 [Carica papaya]